MLTKRPLIWDMTLAWNAWLRDDITLQRFWRCGFDVLGLTVGGGNGGRSASLQGIRSVREMVRVHPDQMTIVRGVEDLRAAQRERKLALVLNFQGTEPLEGRVEAVREFHRLGVRCMGIVWNTQCDVGSSAASEPDTGLTPFGKRVVAEMNRVGVIVDGTHASYRTTIDAMEISAAPVVFTHGNVNKLHSSYKNLKDDQIKACAATGGVIGISGFGSYMDDPTASPSAVFRQIEHVCELVGPSHVGLGLDFVRQPEIIWAKIRANPVMWPGLRESDFFPPENLNSLRQLMDRAGYCDKDVLGILGENWSRVCAECWKGVESE